MNETALQLTFGLLVALGAVAVVLMPTLRKDRTPGLSTAPVTVEADTTSRERLEHHISQYREALEHGTVCERCLYANPRGSVFCAWCGRRIASHVDQ